MKLFRIRIGLLALLVACAVRRADAQILYNYLSPDVTANIMRVNQINSNLMIDNMIAQQLAFQHLMAVENTGRMKIAAGRATTGFAPSSQNSFLARIDPAHRSEAAKVLEAFQSAMRDQGLKLNDMADGRALALVMAFYGYRGQDPGPRRLNAAREAFRKEMLATPMFQGKTDANRQEEYERLGFLAMLSTGARNEYQRLAAKGDSNARAARDQAERSAMAALGQILTIPAAGVELAPDENGNVENGTGFRDAGERIARQGTGSVLFERRDPSNSAMTMDRVWGQGAAARWLANFSRLMQDRRANPKDMTDCWATAYTTLVYLRNRGTVAAPSQNAWVAVRDHMRRWALANAGWMRASDIARQDACDRMALDAGKLAEEFEADRQRQQSFRPGTDRIGEIFRTPPPSRAHSIAEDAGKSISRNFDAKELSTLERLVQTR